MLLRLLLYLLVLPNFLKLVFSEDSTWVKINEKFESPNGFKVEISNLYLIDMHKMIFDFYCEFPKEKCSEIYKNYRFAAIEDGNRKSHFLKIALGGYCMDDNISEFDSRQFKNMKIEFPTDIFDEDGNRVSFYRTSQIRYEMAVSENESSGNDLETAPFLKLDIPKHVRSEFLTTFANKLEFQCVQPLEPSTLLKLESCPKLRGEILSMNPLMVKFSGVDLTEEAMAQKPNYVNDITFKFAGRGKHGQYIEDYVLTKKSAILKYEGKPINQAAYLPRGLDISHVESLFAINNFEKICHFVIKPSDRKKAADYSKGNDVIPSKVLPENAGKECDSPNSILDGSYKTSDDFNVGSVVQYLCKSGYVLSPKDFYLICAKDIEKNRAKWHSSHESDPFCVRIPEDCESAGDYCQNNGECLVINGKISCVCKKAFYGDLCENFNDPCSKNSCGPHGYCAPQNDFQNFSCICEEGFVGSRCNEVQGLSDKCGDLAIGFKIENGVLVCECTDGNFAPIGEKCSFSKTEQNCDLRRIRNGRIKTDFGRFEGTLMAGQVVDVECEEGFQQTAGYLMCLKDGTLSEDPDKICKDVRNKPQKIDAEKKKTILIVIFWFIVFVLTCIFGYLFFVFFLKKIFCDKKKNEDEKVEADGYEILSDGD